MTARVWTREELDRVHPLDGWVWYIDASGRVSAHDSGWRRVWVTTAGHLCAAEFRPMAAPDPFDPPADVALAVILASKGLDSRETMAAKLESDAERIRSALIASDEMRGRAWMAVAAAMMLRRGRVAP